MILTEKAKIKIRKVKMVHKDKDSFAAEKIQK